MVSRISEPSTVPRFETKTVNYWKQWSFLARLMGAGKAVKFHSRVVMMSLLEDSDEDLIASCRWVILL